MLLGILDIEMSGPKNPNNNTNTPIRNPITYKNHFCHCVTPTRWQLSLLPWPKNPMCVCMFIFCLVTFNKPCPDLARRIHYNHGAKINTVLKYFQFKSHNTLWYERQIASNSANLKIRFCKLSSLKYWNINLAYMCSKRNKCDSTANWTFHSSILKYWNCISFITQTYKSNVQLYCNFKATPLNCNVAMIWLHVWHRDKGGTSDKAASCRLTLLQ